MSPQPHPYSLGTISSCALLFMSALLICASAAAQNAGTALQFNGSNQYVSFGVAQPQLGLPQFTIETWFKRTGAGVGTTTGSGGIPDGIPLVAKGRAETDGTNVDMNYFLGISASKNTLAADFEEGATAASPGLNHPVYGVTQITSNVWHHAAETYDGTTWKLYLDGKLETTLTVGQLPRSDSIQWASIATAMDSKGTAAGFFNGVLDEVRIWNFARSASQISAGMGIEIPSATGLVGRWGMNEGSGTTIADSSGNGVTGRFSATAPLWVAGFPLSGGTTGTNQPPVVNAGSNQTITLPASATLSGTATDDGLPNPPGALTLSWTKVSGPGTVTFAKPAAASTAATFSTSGTYVLQLTANDSLLSTSATVTITVQPVGAKNKAPVVSAGANQTITLPSSAALSGTATDDGLPNPPGALTLSWTKVSGPGTVTFANPAAASTTAGFSTSGTYVLQLTANDSQLSTSASTAIAVNPAGPPPSGGTALQFSGTNQYVSFGVALPQLGVPQFTIETWFKRLGAGTGTSTGTGGLPDGIPLVAKGRAEADGSNVDMNYFLGISTSKNVLAADFEEGATATSPGLNHPVYGVTPITSNVWHHAAATYNGTWNIYLDGKLETTSAVGQPPRSDSIQWASIATAMNSTGAPAGFFNGVLDEVRIWNFARTASQISAGMNVEIPSAPGLVGRWGMNEGSGTSIFDSSGSGITGLFSASAPLWVAGYPFSGSTTQTPPATPGLISPASAATGVSRSAGLNVSVSDPDQDNMTVTFFGRAVPTAFTMVVLPDTQFYSASLNGGTPSIFNSQTSWIVTNRAALNIAYVAQLGDIVQDGDSFVSEWMNADAAMKRLEDPVATGLTNGIPYGVAVGNHDQTPEGSATGTTTLFNQWFGTSRFSGRPYYGGHYGSDNNNHYDLFSAGGMDFIVVHLEYDTSANPAVLSWANGVLQQFSNRRAIVVSHYIIVDGSNAAFGTQGGAIYSALKGNANLFLMLCGHVTSGTEGQNLSTFGGNSIYTLMSDYQILTNGGNGWLRIMQFLPSSNQIQVSTYSPWLKQTETTSSGQFTIPYKMQSSTVAFNQIGTASASGASATASTTWTGLSANTSYQWYVTVSDGTTTVTSPTWTFTTGSN